MLYNVLYIISDVVCILTYPIDACSFLAHQRGFPTQQTRHKKHMPNRDHCFFRALKFFPETTAVRLCLGEAGSKRGRVPSQNQSLCGSMNRLYHYTVTWRPVSWMPNPFRLRDLRARQLGSRLVPVPELGRCGPDPLGDPSSGHWSLTSKATPKGSELWAKPIRNLGRQRGGGGGDRGGDRGRGTHPFGPWGGGGLARFGWTSGWQMAHMT